MASTPQEAAAKWRQNLSASTQAIQQGVQNTTVAPGQAAARQQAQYIAGVQASAQKWATNVSKVSLSDWQQSMIQKGLPRIAGGATAAEGDFTDFMTKLLPYQNNLKGTLPARGSLEENIARSAAWIRGMSNFSR